MSTVNAKCRAGFDEWLKSIPACDLELYVFTDAAKIVDFGSEDFRLVNRGVSQISYGSPTSRCQLLQTRTDNTVFQLSTGEPVGCYMIEARVNTKTKDKQLLKMFRNRGSASLATDPSLLAFALFPKSMDGHCLGQDVKQALKESPVLGESVVNKVHVQWSPAVTWEDGKPRFAAGVKPFVFEKIPFEKYNVDGSKAKKKGKGKK